MVYSAEEKEIFAELRTRLVVEIRRCKTISLEFFERDLAARNIFSRAEELPIPGDEHKYVLGVIDLFRCTAEHSDVGGNAYAAMQKYYDNQNGGLFTPHQLFNIQYALRYCRNKPNSFAADVWRETEKTTLKICGKRLEDVVILR